MKTAPSLCGCFSSDSGTACALIFRRMDTAEVRVRKQLFFRHLSSLGSDSNHFPHGTQYTTSGSFQRTSAHVHNNDHSLISSFDSTSSHHRQPTRVHRHVVACCGSGQQCLFTVLGQGGTHSTQAESERCVASSGHYTVAIATNNRD